MSELNKTNVSRTTFVIGLIFAIVVSSLISAVLIMQLPILQGLKGEKGDQGPQGLQEQPRLQDVPGEPGAPEEPWLFGCLGVDNCNPKYSDVTVD